MSDDFTTVSRNSVEVAHACIKERIISGVFPPGAPLREAELAELTGVSRTPVREALRRLELDGFVSFEPNKGARVPNWEDDDLQELFELRALLEGHAAKIAARRMTNDVLDELGMLAEQMLGLGQRKTPDRAAITELNQRFHGLILEATGQRRLQLFMRGLVQVPLVHRTFYRYSPDALLRSLRHHVELHAALSAGNSEWSESVMRSHVLAAHQELVGE